MSKKPETKFRAKIRPLLDLIPGAWFESIQQKSIIGTPDIIGTISGIFIALELKASIKSPISKMQEYKLKEIVKAGGHAYIVCPENWNKIYEKLIEIAKEAP